MTTNSIGRAIYSILSITGAIICLIIVLSLIYRLYWNNGAQSCTNQSKFAMQPTMRMKLCSISCGIVLCIGFICKSLIISSVIDKENAESNIILVVNNLGNLLMDCGQALYFKYFILSIRKLYRY